MKFDEIFHDQMAEKTEALLIAVLFAANPEQTHFFSYYNLLRDGLEQIGRGGFQGAEYLALIVRLTRRLNALRAQRDSGGMKGISMLLLPRLNLLNLLACRFLITQNWSTFSNRLAQSFRALIRIMLGNR
jgi:hypothetical protein